MNLLSKIISPWYPSVALGLEQSRASIVDLQRIRGGSYSLRRASTLELGQSLLNPDFDQSNIPDPAELTSVLHQLAASVTLHRHKRWSVTMPEATTRTLITTVESKVGAASELDEVLHWKFERGFGASPEELIISSVRLGRDTEGRDRFLATGIRTAVLGEYEAVFRSLGWRVGLILPRHVGETRWLTLNGSAGDSLLISSSAHGFIAVVVRDNQPFILRTVSCELQECEDELYRLLLFYRERSGGDSANPSFLLRRLMVLGDRIPKERVTGLVNDTLAVNLRVLEAHEVGLQLPTGNIAFDAIAAPAGLATLAQ